MAALLPLGASAGEPRWVQFDANREVGISIDVNSVLRVNADVRKAWIQHRYFFDKSSRTLLYYVQCKERTYRMTQEIFRGPRGEMLQSQEWDAAGKYQDVEPGESWDRMIDKVCAAKLSD